MIFSHKYKRLCLCLCVSLCLNAFGEDSFTLVSESRIGYGDDRARLGSLGPGNDNWSPLFFSVLPDGNLSIPDYYKERIAIFTPKGEFIKDIQIAGIMSPRMNYFGTTGTGHFIVFNDSVLYCLSPDGAVLWNVPFPIGVFPQSIYASASVACFSLDNGSGTESGVSVSVAPPFTTLDSTFRSDKTAIPYIPYGTAFYGYTLSDTVQIKMLSKKPFFPGSVPGNARFLSADAGGNSLYLSKEDTAYRVFVLSESGKLIFSASVPATDSSSWNWTVATLVNDSLSLYLHEAGSDGMEIRVYQAKITQRVK